MSLREDINELQSRGEWGQVREIATEAMAEVYTEVLASLAIGDSADAGRILERVIRERMEAAAEALDDGVEDWRIDANIIYERDRG